MGKLLAIGLAGFAGALARYLLGGWVSNAHPTAFPLGTLVINTSGAFLLGLAATVGLDRALVNPSLRVVITVGFLGAYTTFSTFSLETMSLAESGSWGLAGLNLLLSVLLGLFAVWAGQALGRSI